MSHLENFDVKFSITLLDALHYSTYDVLKIITRAAYDSQSKNTLEISHSKRLSTAPESSIPTDTSASAGSDNSSEKYRIEYLELIKEIYETEELRDLQNYYTDRLIRLISNGKIELWNNNLTKIIDLAVTRNSDANDSSQKNPIPIDVALRKLDEYNKSILDGSFAREYRAKPKNVISHSPLHQNGRYLRQYEIDPYLLILSMFAKSDLIEFCNSQKIKIIYEKANNTSSIPGKIPRISIAKIAIEIAWEIEKKSGNRATAAQVMQGLKTRMTNGENSEVLLRSLNNGVEWSTSKNVPTIYTRAMCSAALTNWNKSRINKIETNSTTAER
jgi:hypothetical protein